MKKRNQARRKRSQSRGFSSAVGRQAHKRRTWTFEKLEERQFLTATPLSGLEGNEWLTISSDSLAGKQLIDLLAYEFQARVAASNSSVTSTSQPMAVPPISEFSKQWHLFNVGQLATFDAFQGIYGVPGQDINVLPVWQDGITGNGIFVAVVDSGVQLTHPDLLGNISTIYGYNALTNNSGGGPTSSGPDAAHGTAVAGLIAAIAGNGVDFDNDGEIDGVGVGVAFGSTIVPIKYLVTSFNDPLPTDQTFVNMINANGAPIDIYNHSLGPFDLDNMRGVAGLTPAELAALVNSVTNGRNGLGAIHVFAAGNSAGNPDLLEGLGFLDSAGSNGLISRYTIGVGMVDHDGSLFNSDGTITTYGEAGTSILVVAPSASGPFDIGVNLGTGSGIFTTDLTGNNGSNLAIGNDGDTLPNPDYTSKFGGTSAAAPLVSGVIALMLEADKLANGGVATLSYRDVQEILVRSARQNDPTDRSWIVNPTPLFWAPISPEDNINYEVEPGEEEGEYVIVRAADSIDYHPIATPRTRSVPATRTTNGAGYTVSHGWMSDYGNEYGFAHGVVDAELAVAMASQWNLKDQTLAPEQTVLKLLPAGGGRILAAAVSEGFDGPGDESLVPGSLYRPGIDPVDDGNFIDYYQEFFKEPAILEEEDQEPIIDPESLPFQGEDDPPVNDRGSAIVIDGPDNMSVEWVEVKLDISYGDANALDFLRIVLTSPDGTRSELTHYQYTGDYRPPVEYAGAGFGLDGTQQYQRGTAEVVEGGVFTWGRIDPPGSLDSDLDGDGVFSWIYSTNRHWGERSEGHWTIDFENYGGTELTLEETQVIFHGQPIGSLGQSVNRVLGFVNDSAGYLGHASNVTVYVEDLVGNRVAQFITGADGNYYFDLPSGNYTLGIDVPEGYEVTPGTPSEVPLSGGFTFSIRPLANEAISHNVAFTGSVFADLDGDSVKDAVDAGVFGFLVYADLNHTGQFELGEPSTTTLADGSYTLPTITIQSATVISIGVKPPPGWTATSPLDGIRDVFAEPMVDPDVIEIAVQDFGIKPPSAPTGEGSGNVFGFVFDDENGDGIRQSQFEGGAANVRVYVDAGVMNGQYDDGETYIFTNPSGAFAFSDLGPGSFRLRVDLDLPLVLTAPMIGYRDVTVTAGEVLQGITFGVQNLAIDDFGDLFGTGFRTTLAQDGPRHKVVPGFQLGSRVDAEMDTNTIEDFSPTPPNRVPNPALHGIGDDLKGPEDDMMAVINDDDGVSIVGGFMRPGANTFEIELNGVGGYLNAWIDLNDDGDFDDTVNGISEHVINSIHRNTGTHQFVIETPAGLDGGADGKIAARFRWGSFGINYFGADTIGEVEDYLFQVMDPLPGDYDLSGYVDEDDFLFWRNSYGNSVVPGTGADGNGNGFVDAADYGVWRDNLGMGTPPGGGTGSGSAIAEGGAESNLVLPGSQIATESELEQVVTNTLASSDLPGASQIETATPLVSVSVPFHVSNSLASQIAGSTTTIEVIVSPTANLTQQVSGSSAEALPSSLISPIGQFSTATSTRIEIAGDGVLSSGSSIPNVSLSLLDDVLARLTLSDNEADAEYSLLEAGEGDEEISELAMVAAFDEQEYWWSSL